MKYICPSGDVNYLQPGSIIVGIDYGVCKRCAISRDRVRCRGLIYGTLEVRDGVLFGINGLLVFRFRCGGKS